MAFCCRQPSEITRRSPKVFVLILCFFLLACAVSGSIWWAMRSDRSQMPEQASGTPTSVPSAASGGKKPLLLRENYFDPDDTLTFYTLYEYNVAGQEIRKAYYDANLGFDLLEEDLITYDPYGRKSRAERRDSNGIVHTTEYIYNDIGQLTREIKTDKDGHTSYIDYEYDALGQNFRHRASSGYTVEYKHEYNDLGQLVCIISSFNGADDEKWTKHQYDAAGLLVRTESYQGTESNMTGYMTYEYDDENIIISAPDQNRQESVITYFMLEDEYLCSIDKDGKITYLETFEGEPLLNDNGTVLVDDDYIYFHVDTIDATDTTDGEVSLAKRKVSGGDTAILRRISWNLNTGKPDMWQIDSGYIYYLFDNQICRVNTDGSDYAALPMGPLFPRTNGDKFVVKEDWIYYDSRNEGVYKIRFDGTQKTQFVDNSQFYSPSTLLAIIGETVHMIDLSGSYGTIDGNLEMACSLFTSDLEGNVGFVGYIRYPVFDRNVLGSWFFWTTDNSVFCVQLTGEHSEPISSLEYPDTMIGDWCYSNTYHHHDFRPTRFSLDGTRYQKLQNDTMNLTPGEELIYANANPADYLGY